MRKITLGVFVFSLIALLGVGMVSSFPFGFGKEVMKQNLTEEEQIEIQSFHDSLQEAIENEDFDLWKELMESQITEENFNKILEQQHAMEKRESEMEEAREEFCEQNECPEPSEFEEGEFPENFGPRGHHGMRKNFETGEYPIADNSE